MVSLELYVSHEKMRQGRALTDASVVVSFVGRQLSYEQKSG
jgi:hypothetical protein